MASTHTQDLKAELASAVLFYDEQRKRGKREIIRLRNELTVELRLQNQHEIDTWRFRSDQDVISRWESGNIDYAQVIEHISIAERIVDAYTRLRPSTLPPESHLVQLTAKEADVGRCNTPLDTPSWPREFSDLGQRNPFRYEEALVLEREITAKQDLVEHKKLVLEQASKPAALKPLQTIERAPSKSRKAPIYISTMDEWDDWSDNELCRRWEEGSISKEIAENDYLANRLRSAYFNRSGVHCSPPLVKYIQGTAEEAILNGYSTPKQTKAWQVLFGELKRPDSSSGNAQPARTTVNDSTINHDSIALSLQRNPRRISLRPTVEFNDNLVSPTLKDESHNLQAEVGFTYTLIGESDTQHDLTLEAPHPSSGYRDAVEEQNLTIRVATLEATGLSESPLAIGSEVSDLHVKIGSGKKRLRNSWAVKSPRKKTSRRQQFTDEDTDSEEPLPMSKRQRKALRAEMASHNKPGKMETASKGLSIESQSDVNEDRTLGESPRMKKARKNIIKTTKSVAKMKKKKKKPQKDFIKELKPHNEPGFDEEKAADSGRGSRAAKMNAKKSLERLDWKIPSSPIQKKWKDS